MFTVGLLDLVICAVLIIAFTITLYYKTKTKTL